MLCLFRPRASSPGPGASRRRSRARPAANSPLPDSFRLNPVRRGGRAGGSMTSSDFTRIRRLPPYVFAEVNAMKAAARARGEGIVDLGMGNPDGAPPPHVVDKLAEVARNSRAHRYSASKGIPGLRKAQAAYYQRRLDRKSVV